MGETLKEYNSRPMLSVTGISNILDILFNAQEQFSEAMSKQILDRLSILIINPTLREKLPMDNFEKAKEVLKPIADAEFIERRQELKEFLDRGSRKEKKGIKTLRCDVTRYYKSWINSLYSDKR